MLGAAWRVVFLAGLVTTGASMTFRDVVLSWVGTGLVPGVVVYVAALAAFHGAVGLPVAYYHDVVLERRYGLSAATTSTWGREYLQATGLGLAGLLTAALIVSGWLRWSPEWWWVGAAACVTLLLVLLGHVAPVVLLPLVQDLRPLPEGNLRRRVLALATRADVPVLAVYEWRLGPTKRANAALVGFGRSRRVLLSDTLLRQHSDDEIEAVIAHEFAHHVYGDLWTALGVRVLLVVAACYVGDVVLTAWAGAAGLSDKADLAALPLLALAGGAASMALIPLSHALSRAHERRADRYALDMTGNVDALIGAIRRLAAQNLAEERPSLLVRMFFHAHPPFASRIEAARSWTVPPRREE